MLKQIYNLRIYSWVDLIFIGILAKILIAKSLIFDFKDIVVLISLICLWMLYQLILELSHNYQYRAKPSLVFVFLILFASILISMLYSPLTTIFIFSSTFSVYLYILKNKNQFFGSLSIFLRGLIQSQYFFYALLFYTKSIEIFHIYIGFLIFLIYTARALVGDMRDYKHNKTMNKKTLPVNLGIKISKVLILMILGLSVFVISILSKIVVSFPLILFLITIIFYRNYYVLHQLSIFVTSFVSINLIMFFTNGNLFVSNLIFLGILLNMAFYPLLERKSNPEFK